MSLENFHSVTGNEDFYLLVPKDRPVVHIYRKEEMELTKERGTKRIHRVKSEISNCNPHLSLLHNNDDRFSLSPHPVMEEEFVFHKPAREVNIPQINLLYFSFQTEFL